MTKKFNAFTLAEVLITLGIIGVVAAMTMPTLINQTNGAQYKAAYKKALSAISQAITLNVALEDKSFADAKVASTTDAPANSVSEFLKKRMNVVSLTETAGYTIPTVPYEYEYTCTSEDIAKTSEQDPLCGGKNTTTKVTKQGANVTNDIYMFFNDSSMFAFSKAAKTTGCKASDPCFGIIDVNGQKGPNKLTTCTTTAAEDGSTTCNADTLQVNDIYPVAYYDQSIRPASAAAKEVLYGK